MYRPKPLVVVKVVNSSRSRTLHRHSTLEERGLEIEVVLCRQRGLLFSSQREQQHEKYTLTQRALRIIRVEIGRASKQES
jgi:hypothetical protein